MRKERQNENDEVHPLRTGFRFGLLIYLADVWQVEPCSFLIGVDPLSLPPPFFLHPPTLPLLSSGRGSFPFRLAARPMRPLSLRLPLCVSPTPHASGDPSHPPVESWTSRVGRSVGLADVRGGVRGMTENGRDG